MIHSLLSIPCVTLQGEAKTLGDFRARAYLVVNTASKCGFTPQYRGLENLWQYYRERGLMVLGFPCNQFGSQEPGDPLEIANFCTLNYGVSFPLFSKIEVNGPGAHPLFSELKRLAPGVMGSQRIKWNFTKFLLTADGQRVTRYAPITKPERLFDRIETLL
ncbi:glutathione peroxidase [Serratia entomophila]|uniref:glutathione peroxidase n=1 Tax=Serratia entomophila TaxID=42906 RepID=UPI00217B5B2F|nr:glutathione peroxidase [Serratia entomophila]CAI0756275.1 Glutathione peroxidase homolog BsaA [Serratia entomophila]CAI0823282.1 Glutathione peroxidase homolog BsaA [Serratia entomophila]CAI0824441.1 Glutathione peroxidase homolog BsaA [Serratia entomophila]CAI0825837.1 Glutathione peroxidase homolog BsaA [Serratia entomophila]CAI1568366.1 Glutathione peroxidase homolog BsaA [Serratia entomophila]